LALALDVTEPGQVTAAVEQAEDRFGGVDVLVNNAGYGYRAAVEEGDDEDVRQPFDTNFFGAVAMIKAVLPGMRARRSGAIVNVSSIGARIRHRQGTRRRARRTRGVADLSAGTGYNGND
jgi:NAD(P)-dependent dehydrogenase (short-subunit alcohol dehydrogenase family)